MSNLSNSALQVTDFEHTAPMCQEITNNTTEYHHGIHIANPNDNVVADIRGQSSTGQPSQLSSPNQPKETASLVKAGLASVEYEAKDGAKEAIVEQAAAENMVNEHCSTENHKIEQTSTHKPHPFHASSPFKSTETMESETTASAAMNMAFDKDENGGVTHQAPSIPTHQSELSNSATGFFASTSNLLPGSSVSSPQRIPESDFNSLPDEIRQKIFGYTFYPRLIEVEIQLSPRYGDPKPKDKVFIRTQHVGPPVALFINRESRAFALQHYRPLFNLKDPKYLPPKLAWHYAGRDHPSNTKEVYFNPKIDHIAFEQTLFDLENIEYLLGRGAALYEAQNVKFVFEKPLHWKFSQPLRADEESVLQFFNGIKYLHIEVVGGSLWSSRPMNYQLDMWEKDVEGYLQRGCEGSHLKAARVHVDYLY